MSSRECVVVAVHGAWVGGARSFTKQSGRRPFCARCRANDCGGARLCMDAVCQCCLFKLLETPSSPIRMDLLPTL